MAGVVFNAKRYGSTPYRGLVKLKLIHAPGISLLVPDQLFLTEPLVWFQPRTFLPNILAKDGTDIYCRLFFDIDGGHSIGLKFSNKDLVRSLPDGSFLYNCSIEGPANLPSFASGVWELINEIPHLILHHHTHDQAYAGIHSSAEFRASVWNIQGNKKLVNIGYVYFTDLPVIRNSADLAAIAMSPNRVLHFLVDNVPMPRFLPPNWKKTHLASQVLEVKVYWSEPEQRNRTIKVVVDSTILAPHHLLRHVTDHVWYEVSCPSIFRVGVAPGNSIPFDGTFIRPQGTHKVFDYMVIGDATSVNGLSAPLDEENTQEIFRIHKLPEPPLEFWFNHSNQDHFSGLPQETQEFEKP